MYRNMERTHFFMKRLSEYLFFGTLGGIIYYTGEIIFRGFSHWSMFVLAGINMIFFVQQGWWVHWRDPLWLQVLRCIIFTLSGEFITGILVNKILHLNVWDYGRLPFNLFGQICLPFAIIFSGLCLIGIYLTSYLSYRLYGEEKAPFLKKKKMIQ